PDPVGEHRVGDVGVGVATGEAVADTLEPAPHVAGPPAEEPGQAAEGVPRPRPGEEQGAGHGGARRDGEAASGPDPGGLPVVGEPPAGIDAIDEEHRSLLPTVAPHTHRRRWPTAEARYATPGPASRRERAL